MSHTDATIPPEDPRDREDDDRLARASWTELYNAVRDASESIDQYRADVAAAESRALTAEAEVERLRDDWQHERDGHAAENRRANYCAGECSRLEAEVQRLGERCEALLDNHAGRDDVARDYPDLAEALAELDAAYKASLRPAPSSQSKPEQSKPGQEMESDHV